MAIFRRVIPTAAVCGALACSATASTSNWAAAQIRAVTKAGVLGQPGSAFQPEAPLTQGALASAIAAADQVQYAAASTSPPPKPAPIVLTSTVGPGAVIAGTTPIDVDAPGRGIDHVDFAVDGTGVSTAIEAPYELDLDTTKLADGPHTLAVNVVFAGGGYAIATWQVTVANAQGSAVTPPGEPADLPIAKSGLPAPPAAAPTTPVGFHPLYRTASPGRLATVKQLDAALVAYLGLGPAAREIQTTLEEAGLAPPPNTGTEAVARLLGLRLNHPASQDSLELLPNEAATRAEAAYSFARVLAIGDTDIAQAQADADAFTLPTFTPWQQRILATAVHYVGYPYVWGGTSPTAETLFGVHSAGGFDCSGFVWRVFKLTSYPGEGNLANVIQGRTTYVMSGEVPRSARITQAKLQPADVMFFGADGPRSKPAEVDHTAIYLGNGWFIQSSDEGVTLLPFAGWYTQSFAWGRRPLREAGLTG
ncbi:MAG TPA: NlpC/P60 family protein [Gaiellaceae bacterium]|nr:NlpC/P60 family protein [Gaiellaceae bacterium]